MEAAQRSSREAGGVSPERWLTSDDGRFMGSSKACKDRSVVHHGGRAGAAAAAGGGIKQRATSNEHRGGRGAHRVPQRMDQQKGPSSKFRLKGTRPCWISIVGGEAGLREQRHRWLEARRRRRGFQRQRNVIVSSSGLASATVKDVGHHWCGRSQQATVGRRRFQWNVAY